MNRRLYTFQQFIRSIPLKRIFTLAICAFFSFGTDLVSPSAKANDTVDYLFALNNIEVISSDTIDREFPTRAKMDPNKEHTSLSYRVQTVLPYTKDRNADAYIVYPEFGVVVPVLTPSASDSALISAGKNFNHYPYLQNGALHYFGNSPSQGAGNMSIASHSSYYKTDPGRYKTVFQVLPLSHKGDIVWYFEKNTKGSYDLYEYEITESYETDKNNVSILSYDNDGKSYLTTYGCYPIGSNEKRWVNKALLKRTTLEHSSLDNITPATNTHKVPVTPIPGFDTLVATNTLPSNKAMTRQDMANKVAAAIQQGATTENNTMLAAAPIVKPMVAPTTLIATKSIDNNAKITLVKNKLLALAKLQANDIGSQNDEVSIEHDEIIPLKPSKKITIDITDSKKLLRNIIVETTTLGAGSVIDVTTTVNPLLAPHACYVPKESSIIALGKNTKARDQIVFQGLMYAYGLTSFTDTDSYNPENGLKRYEAAKILVNFAKNILCRQAKTVYKEGMYKDISGIDPTLAPYIKEAYEYGIMKGGKGKFRPLDRISKQEFIAGLMRILLNSYLTEGNDKDWYKNYETVFADYNLKNLILTDTTINRYDMSKIFYKIYYNDQYQWTDQGYVLPSTVE